jgi:glycosyltransferase involved in cell wall biosynthesis
MFLAHPLRHDTRVEKEAAALTDAGYEVRIVATAFPGLPAREERSGFTVVRVDDDPLPARAIRSLLRNRSGGGAPGTVLTRESAERRDLRARLVRGALRVHLRMVWRRYMREALRAVRDRPAAVWVAHDLETLPLALRARERHGGRVLYDSHELFVESSLARWEGRRWTRIERRTIGRADAVVTVSDSIAGELARRYGIAVPHVILNAPDYLAPEDEHPVDLRRELDLPADARIALYLGGIVQHRGLEQLIDAAAVRSDLAVVMLGPSSDAYRGGLERLAAERGVAERTRFLPPVAPSEIRRHAVGADVGISTIQDTFLNYRYALPNKLFDYLHAGLPVVASDFPDMRALVERYGVGAVCDPASPRSVAEAIDRVAGDPQMREKARAAAQDFTWAREREKLVGLVRGLVG